LKRLRMLVVLCLAVGAMTVALTVAPTAGAYGNAAVWQVGISLNCDVPHSSACDQFGGTGGEWGWYEFDSDNTGDAQITGCGHTVGGIGGSGGAGAGHSSVDITSWHIAPSSGALPFPAPSGTFWIDSDITTFTGHGAPVTLPNQFVGDTGIPAAPGRYSFHPAPGVTAVVTVALKPTA